MFDEELETALKRIDSNLKQLDNRQDSDLIRAIEALLCATSYMRQHQDTKH